MEKIFNIDFNKELSKEIEQEKEIELAEARKEIEEMFSKYVLLSNKISISTIQRKLHIGYCMASKFIEMMAIKNIVTSEFGARDILDKQLLVEEAAKYFAPIVRDRNKLEELNKYDVFAYVVNDEFDANRVSYFWLNRLISEHFAKDEEYIKKLDEIFNTTLFKEEFTTRTKSILNNRKIDFELLAVVTLQYFAEKLKKETLNKRSDIDRKLKLKIKNLRFFEKG